MRNVDGIAWRWVAAGITAFAATNGSALGANLVANGSFENGLTGWTSIASSAAVISYGTPQFPSVAMGAKIGGGSRFLRDLGGGAIVEQVVPLGFVPPGTNLLVGGYFGGGNTDASRMVIRFLNSGGTEIALRPLEWVTQENRNLETVFLLRQAIHAIPSGTASIAVRIEMKDNCCSGTFGGADAIFVELTTAPTTPSAVALDVELLNNGNFENGWTAGSPLSLNDPRGWEGVHASGVIVKPYSDADPSVPGTNVSCVIGGGLPDTSCIPGGAGNLLSHLDGNGAVRQRIDVRGNAAQFTFPPSLAVRVSAALGGVGDFADHTRVEVRFLKEDLVPIAPVAVVGPVTQADRNSETVVLLRTRDLPVLPGTAYVEVDVVFNDTCCSGARGLVDNVSAKLVAIQPAPPVAINTNLATNGGFENGSLPGSPLELANPTGWSGLNTSKVELLAYGSSSNVPPASFGTANGLGGLVLSDLGSGSGLTRRFDVSAASALIDINRYRAYFQAWLGGVGTQTDSAELRATFLNAFGGQVGSLVTIGPVTAADRANQTTLLLRDQDIAIPPLTRSILIELRFNDFCCSGAFGLADGIRTVIYDTLVGGPSMLPGSGEDLRLFTGVNTGPTTGPGEDFKTASPGDIIYLRIESPGGTFQYTPLLLAANVYPNGGPMPTPPAQFPSLQFDPFQMIVLANGYGCVGFGCFSVLPGGTPLAFGVPAALAGKSILIQALAIPVPGTTPPPINGTFAASDAHVIQA